MEYSEEIVPNSHIHVLGSRHVVHCSHTNDNRIKKWDSSINRYIHKVNLLSYYKLQLLIIKSDTCW